MKKQDGNSYQVRIAASIPLFSGYLTEEEYFNDYQNGNRSTLENNGFRSNPLFNNGTDENEDEFDGFPFSF